jgi:Pyruvate/2-oxoacid:ferredoxin oxidoreductase gamma subunit
VALVNSSVAEWETTTRAQVVAVPASDIAIDTGNPMAVSMVLVGAYASATGLVSLVSLADAVRQALPTYRAQHIDLSLAALNAGAAAVVAGSAPAWIGPQGRSQVADGRQGRSRVADSDPRRAGVAP